MDSGSQGYEDAAVLNLDNIDRLPVKDAIEIYLRAAKELIEGADPHRLYPHLDVDDWLYEAKAALKLSQARFTERFGRSI